MTDLPEPVADLSSIDSWGRRAWGEFEIHRQGRAHRFVPADYIEVHDTLRRLRPRAETFLELGSGVGVITVLAERLGYHACGIEADEFLHERSEALAEMFGSDATFALGSFLPEAFRPIADFHSSEFLTLTDAEPAYDDLGMDLDDFDLVYVFPWPGEEEVLFELMKRHGSPTARLLTYGATEGCRLYRQGEEIDL